MNITIIVLGSLSILAGMVMLFVLNLSRQMEYEKKQLRNDSNDPIPEPKLLVWPALLIVLGFACIILAFCFTIVPTGYTGVRTTFGLIDQESCMPGFNALAPFVQKISLVNNKQQDVKITDRIWSETKEQTVVFMENTVVTYRIVPESSAWIYANVENWVEELLDNDIVSSALKSASRRLTADVVTDRGTIEPLAVETLQAAVDEKYGENRVEIKNIIINNMDFEESYNAAIAKKSAAIQEQQEQAIRNQTNIDKATAEAAAARAQAEGEADAERIRAQGKADANKLIAGSISDATQRQDAIEKWNGELPRYMGGENAMFGILDTVDDQPTVSGN